MSTATLTVANGVRPRSAIKADFAARLAQQPQSILADVKNAIAWAPKKVQRATIAALRWLHVPQFLSFAQRNIGAFLGVVGKGAFATEMLTSHWGQKTIVKTLQISGAVVGWTVKASWRVLTSPLRLFSPTRAAVEKVEAAVATANARLTPNSGQTFGPLQIARDMIGHAVSADRPYIKVVRTTAIAVMAVRVTRRFIPIGWLRMVAYTIDGIMIARAYLNDLEHTWVGKQLRREAAVIEADVLRQSETVVAEATHMTRESASSAAAKLRQEAAEVEAAGKAAAQQARSDVLVASEDQAATLRREAAAMEATAERLEAAEIASAAAEATQTAATVVEERPKPTPTPPMGGRTPGNGPQQGGQHPRHGNGGGSQKGRQR